jgi:micrococcal nuclease
MQEDGDFRFYEYKAFVTSVYDGDSITCDLDLGLNVWLKNQKIRLLGIDTPEIRGEERELGLISKARTQDLVLNKEV